MTDKQITFADLSVGVRFLEDARAYEKGGQRWALRISGPFRGRQVRFDPADPVTPLPNDEEKQG